MSSQPNNECFALSWAVRSVRLPLLSLRCLECGATTSTAERRMFRVNANKKLLDVWLLADCVRCGATTKIAVHERVPVRSVDRLRAFEDNDPRLVERVLLDPRVARRNRFTLDWDGAWHLDAPEVPPLDADWPVCVEVAFEAPVPLRPDRLIGRGLGLSRSAIERRVKCEIALTRKTSHAFTFVLLPRL
ncbi:DUF1062 domain-containing protein [Actinomadura sp. KC216]|nr:DUF1062 domain-containing protein [Actinomadura sp. KC216]TDB83130.1 DUF1062 domain-containing protein [Actinomadura sp. KC216]